ncbi:hypothetical protein [Limnoglobus roseus]|uniref:Glycosyltransferase RgtA/B/C/D-like domain-containing protein n=1 Tax=Limnoglobus roseus TaxID=2598579 RepID=A0A5C1AFA5_9BACT|nr:hypothetical protein [Limnoglobus roseus]QEL18099.1 hypothetical protein PX52LOC_05113 [Limnoglobus roseus]
MASRRQQWWPYLVVFLLAALPAANTLIPTVEHDTWWHLRIGKFIADTGTVPQTDPISRIGQDENVPWRAYSWLYEWAIYQVHAVGGVTGIMWFRTLLAAGSTGAVFAFIFRRSGLTPTGLMVAAGVVVLVMPMAPERPWHVTIAFTTMTLWATIALRDGMPARRAWWLIPLFALWANLHIQYVLGWGVLGLACLFPGQASRRQLSVLLVGTVLATIANPYHVHLFEVIWEYATQAAPRSLVQELSAPDLASRWTVAVASLIVWAVVKWFGRRPVDGFELGLLLAGAFLASRMYRDLWFGALAAAAVIRDAGEESVPRPRTRTIVGIVFAAFLLLRILNSVGLLADTDYAAAHAKKYPVHAAAFLRETRPPGPIFNDFDWGGYLAWELPEYPVSFDGRTNLYGNERMTQSYQTWSVEDGWKTDPDLRVANVVLAQKGRLFETTLREQSDRWRLIFEDDISTVFQRTAP